MLRCDVRDRLVRKRPGKESKLCYQANALMDNRHGLIVDTEVLHASGTAERDAALVMLDRLSQRAGRGTLGAGKGHDTAAFVAGLRERNITPHVAQNITNRRSAIDGRTTRHAGYAVSQCKRKEVEQTCGWQKTVGLMRKLKPRGLELATWMFTFSTTAYNLVRMRRLLLAAVSP